MALCTVRFTQDSIVLKLHTVLQFQHRFSGLYINKNAFWKANKEFLKQIKKQKTKLPKMPLQIFICLFDIYL